MARALSLFALLSAPLATVLAEDPDCPLESGDLASSSEGGKHHTTFHNEAHYPINLYWVDHATTQHLTSHLRPGQSLESNTYVGHAFRARKESGESMGEWQIGADTAVVTMNPCGPDPGMWAPPDRSAEFKKLVHDQGAPCEGDSKTWSCIRSISREDAKARDAELYGFHEGEGPLHQTFDPSYSEHIARMPKITPLGPGYLKMDMPDGLRQKLLDFYAQKKLTDAHQHDPIPGGYTNNHIFPFDHINLDYFRDMHSNIMDEMHPVMEWWTNMTLEHTSTFGIRIYKRNSMLIDHVDREDTHLASAVLQVAQTVDSKGGWPLEVYLPDGGVGEVYLQPGEMVLYEGAWLRHGRPMRFRGDEFANVFSHFKPLPWQGTHDSNPPSFYGYKKGRCTTLADEDGKGCSESIKFVDHHSEL